MPKLSVVLSSNRPHLWARFCSGLTSVAAELEVIIVGPCPPVTGLPVPVKFIVSNAKPTACWELGARAASAPFLNLTCDDMQCSPGLLDDAIALASTSRNVYDTFSGRFIDDGGDQTHGIMMLGYKSMPLLCVGGVSFTDGHHKIGGIERRFKATLFDTDLWMDMFVNGGRCTLLPGHTMREYSTGSTMFVRYSEIDKAVLRSLWFDGDRPTLQRTSARQPFSDADLAQDMT